MYSEYFKHKKSRCKLYFLKNEIHIYRVKRSYKEEGSMSAFKKGIITFLVMVMCIGVSACSSKNNEVETLTNNFENSCNKLDVNAMLDCIDPGVSDKIKKITGFVGLFSDKDTDELIESFASMIFSGLPENSKEFLSSIKLITKDIAIEEETATATATIEYSISGEKYSKEATLEYMNIDGKWYIADLDIE